MAHKTKNVLLSMALAFVSMEWRCRVTCFTKMPALMPSTQCASRINYNPVSQSRRTLSTYNVGRGTNDFWMISPNHEGLESRRIKALDPTSNGNSDAIFRIGNGNIFFRTRDASKEESRQEGDGKTTTTTAAAESLNIVKMLRTSAKYINQHRGSTIVLHIPGRLVKDGIVGDSTAGRTGSLNGLESLLADVSLISLLGVKVVLVAGARSLVDARLNERQIPIKYTVPKLNRNGNAANGYGSSGNSGSRYGMSGVVAFPGAGMGEQSVKPSYDFQNYRLLRGPWRITDKYTLQVVKECVGYVRHEIERILWKGFRLGGDLGHDGFEEGTGSISVVGGNNLYTAKPVGVRDGVDYGYTGEVRRVDAEAIRRRLDEGEVVLMTNLGYSPSGEVFNVDSQELAVEVASSLSASKLIYITDGAVDMVDGRVAMGEERIDLAVAQKMPKLQSMRLSDAQELVAGVIDEVNTIGKKINRASAGTSTSTSHSNYRGSSQNNGQGPPSPLEPLLQPPLQEKESDLPLSLHDLTLADMNRVFQETQRDRRVSQEYAKDIISVPSLGAHLCRNMLQMSQSLQSSQKRQMEEQGAGAGAASAVVPAPMAVDGEDGGDGGDGGDGFYNTVTPLHGHPLSSAQIQKEKEQKAKGWQQEPVLAHCGASTSTSSSIGNRSGGSLGLNSTAATNGIGPLGSGGGALRSASRAGSASAIGSAIGGTTAISGMGGMGGRSVGGSVGSVGLHVFPPLYSQQHQKQAQQQQQQQRQPPAQPVPLQPPPQALGVDSGDFSPMVVEGGGLKQKSNHDSALELVRLCALSIRAVKVGGVRRAHLLPPNLDGVLLQELYTRDGCGCLISGDVYEGIRLAMPEDVLSIKELIQPLEEEGILAERSIEDIERDIDRYYVYIRDELIVAVGSLTLYPPDHAELGCLVVRAGYHAKGRGDIMMTFMERLALARGVKHMMILTTRTMQWFEERGFVERDVSSLPPARLATYNWNRRSKVCMKTLTTPRAVDEEELLWKLT